MSWSGPTDPAEPPEPSAEAEGEAVTNEGAVPLVWPPVVEPVSTDTEESASTYQYRRLVPVEEPLTAQPTPPAEPMVYTPPAPAPAPEPPSYTPPPSFGPAVNSTPEPPASPDGGSTPGNDDWGYRPPPVPPSAPSEPAEGAAGGIAVETIQESPPAPPPDTPEEAEEEGDDGKPRWRKGLIEWGVILAIAVGAAFVIRIFLIEPFYIPTGSMEPTLDVHDRVLVNKLSYHLHGVHRGDIIVFAKPANDNEPGIKDLVKRVIGLPGEQIASGPNGEILINGAPIKQPWLTAAAKADPGPPIVPMTIPPGEYFVMGDNRGDSSDSRVFGPIAKHLIVGRAFIIVWPLSRFGGL